MFCHFVLAPRQRENTGHCNDKSEDDHFQVDSTPQGPSASASVVNTVNRNRDQAYASCWLEVKINGYHDFKYDNRDRNDFELEVLITTDSESRSAECDLS